MEQNEPSTGEIVRALREYVKMGGYEPTTLTMNLQRASDRLESQERELSGITGELELVKEQALADAFDAIRVITGISDELKALTARAEQAEAREKEAVADIAKFAHTSHTCGHNESGLCKLAADDHGFCEKCPAWVYRGQPQDGEGK